MDTDLDGPTGMCWAAEGEDTRSGSSSAGGAARVGWWPSSRVGRRVPEWAAHAASVPSSYR